MNKIIKLFKRFLKYVPGFRSGKKINMIIGSTYYISCLLAFIIGLVLGGEDTYKLIRFIGGVLLFPAFLFSLIDNIENTL